MRKSCKEVYLSGGMAIRTHEQVAEQLRLRHGWTMSSNTVRLICRSAENKIRRAMAEFVEKEGGWRG